MDPLRHPDLIEISRKLRHQLEVVLAAEQEAAAATLRRRRTVRDRLLEAEDRGEDVSLVLASGPPLNGTVTAVGADHAVIGTPSGAQFVSLSHIVAMGVCSP